MKKILKKNFCATAIGSVPYTNAREACEKILGLYKDIPFWPQMPRRAFYENMYAQYMEGFPAAVADEASRKVWIDTAVGFMEKLEESYRKILEDDYEYFKMTKERAAGFYEFLSQLKHTDLSGCSYVKGHVTGPISFGLSVTDENKQPILYRNELSEIMVKILARKARQQIRLLKEIFKDVIIFIDEPYLVSVGSSVVNIKTSDVISKIGEIVSVIHGEGALAGIHCCGNTDWSILLCMGLDILNFDAYNFSKSLALYPKELREFIDNGKTLAWGIVPTQEEVRKETADTLIKKLEEGFNGLTQKGIEREDVLGSVMITPSCGCGSIPIDDSDRVFDLAVEASRKLKGLYGK